MIPQPRPTNITRTWRADLYGSYGYNSAPVRIGSRIVTLSADAEGNKTALIDGHPASVEAAADILRWAHEDNRLTLLSEVRGDEVAA